MKNGQINYEMSWLIENVPEFGIFLGALQGHCVIRYKSLDKPKSVDNGYLDLDSSAPMLLFLLMVLERTVGIRDIP